MKLLSMRVNNQDRAGAVVGERVLDVTSFLAILGGENERDSIDRPYKDALDLFRHGTRWMESVLSRLSSDPQLANECREAGAL